MLLSLESAIEAYHGRPVPHRSRIRLPLDIEIEQGRELFCAICLDCVYENRSVFRFNV